MVYWASWLQMFIASTRFEKLMLLFIFTFLFIFKYICVCLLVCMCILCMLVTIKSRKGHKNSFNCSYRELLTTEYENVATRKQTLFSARALNSWAISLAISDHCVLYSVQHFEIFELHTIKFVEIQWYSFHSSFFLCV